MTYFFAGISILALLLLVGVAGSLGKIVNGIAVIATVWVVWLENSDDPETLRVKSREIAAALGLEVHVPEESKSG